jgi:ABC-2 type transport system permease protein
MVVMFGSLLAALSTVTDREAGVLRMMLVAPIRRSTVAVGKALGATLLGTAQAIVVAVLLLPLVHLRPTLVGTLLGLVAFILSGLALGTLGVVLAASIRSIENFAGVMNFVVFPMLFLSGALYPVRHLGPVLRVAAHANPLAYGVDLLKHALLGRWAGAGYGGELPVALDCAALAVFAIVGLAAAASLLGREGGVTRTAFRERR